MSEKKPPEREDEDEFEEMESQLLLRMPIEPAQVLRKCLREGGSGLKDRLFVKFETDMRYGEVRFDHWLMYSRLLDLPTITESLKTIDQKSFYKSADVGQMLLCKYDPEPPPTEEESPTKHKKKDPHKVDKKYLWPHGITPPCKNVRKRRFRKTLKKKNVEAPEIEKEVKRLLRTDNEAVSVKWDIVLDDEFDPSGKYGSLLMADENTSHSMDAGDMAGPSGMHINDPQKNSSGTVDEKDIPRDIDIFGEDLSSSDDDDDDHNINVDIDDTSRLSDGDSRSNFSSSMHQDSSMATEFNKRMFAHSPTRSRQISDSYDSHQPSTSQHFGDVRSDDENSAYSLPQLSQDEVHNKIADIRRQLNELRVQQAQKEQEVSSIENETLRQRMQDAVDNILSQMLDKELELEDYQAMLNSNE